MPAWEPPPPTPTPAPAPELTAEQFRHNLACQVLLDRANFSAGCADGKVGPKTSAALRAWQAAKGVPVTGELDAASLARLGPLESALTNYTVTAEDIASLGRVPSGWLEKSQLAALPYQTVLELVAETGHASEGAIRRLNPDADWPDPPPGVVLTIPHPGNNRVRPAANLRVSVGAKTITAYDAAGKMIALFPCSIARGKLSALVGTTLRVVNAADNPTYTFDSDLFREDPEAYALHRNLLIPPGPNNPVGVAWIGLDKPGYGIHGTPRPEDIGKTESHGCLRLANWNAQKLIKMVTAGTPVLIVP